MRVLFVAPTSPDHMACMLYDGLQEVLGESNVVDATDCPTLHTTLDNGQWSLGYEDICAHRRGEKLSNPRNRGRDYDLMVLHSSINRDHDWYWVDREMIQFLKPEGKIAYVEGWDAAWQIVQPEIRMDAVFRKEISRKVYYPYNPNPLGFAAPKRWFAFDIGNIRPYDVNFIGAPDTCHPEHPNLRWDMLRETFRTRYHHRSVVSGIALGLETYKSVMCQSKLALCPVAADSADSLRTYEAVACGAIPIFVGYPDYIRDPWFPPETCFSCSVDTLAEHIDEALSNDLTEKRRLLREHALKHHTTGARARRLLSVLGFEEGRE